MTNQQRQKIATTFCQWLYDRDCALDAAIKHLVKLLEEADNEQ